MRGTVIASIVLFTFCLALLAVGVPLTTIGTIKMVRHRVSDPEISAHYRGIMITGALFNSAAVLCIAIAIGLLPWKTIVGTVKDTHAAVMSRVKQ